MTPKEKKEAEVSIGKNTRLTLGLVVLLIVSSTTIAVTQVAWQSSVNAELRSIRTEIKGTRTDMRNYHSVLGVMNPDLNMPPNMEAANGS